MGKQSLDLMRGTLDLLILKILSRDAMHGYEISKRIGQQTESEIFVEEGALYPALRRMEERNLLSSEWGLSSNNREVKIYQVTPDGERQLKEQSAQWDRYVRAMERVLKTSGAVV
ncbi:PadR family transcriptional regulator [Candidatus Zixiibacteriota bacterium]